MLLKPHSKVLITGMNGFTGVHLAKALSTNSFTCMDLGCDLLNRESVFSKVTEFRPHYVVHLGGISFADEQDIDSIYRVNIVGTVNLLDAIEGLNTKPKKVILASSAAVYGNVLGGKLSEMLCPKPVNHYGCSKLTMEHIARNYFNKFPIIITRPFNYSGVGHSERFLLPKIISAYKNNLPSITLGNLDISREFNDVRDVVSVYEQLMISDYESGIVNICSGKSISLFEIIEAMNSISGYDMKIISSEEFSRRNEINDLSGDNSTSNCIINYAFKYQIRDLLQHMYDLW
jgi:GDP-6-deoxy-D-talose 4-dehydrogenase